MLFVHSFDELFRGDLLCAGTYHNRGAVSVIGAEVETLIAADFLEADPDIGLQILHQMPYVYWTIRIGQS
jgi:hypothetical protein